MEKRAFTVSMTKSRDKPFLYHEDHLIDLSHLREENKNRNFMKSKCEIFLCSFKNRVKDEIFLMFTFEIETIVRRKRHFNEVWVIELTIPAKIINDGDFAFAGGFLVVVQTSWNHKVVLCCS